MYFLSLHNDEDAGVCLMKDGEILDAVSEERFSRTKLHKGFPERSLAYVLARHGLDLSSIDHISYGWHARRLDDYPRHLGKLADRVMQSVVENPESAGIVRRRIANEAEQDGATRQAFETRMAALGVAASRIAFLDHHMSHAWAAFACSPFEDAVVFTFDGRGDQRSSTVAIADSRNGVAIQDYLLTFDSLGYLYGQVTHHLGYKPHRHEGKITGLAARGDSRKTLPLFRELFHWQGDGFQARLGPYEPFFTQINPALAARYSEYSREDLSAGVQAICEEMVSRYVAHWLDKLGGGRPRNVCLAGGVAANVRINQHVAELPGVDNLYVFPHMGDGGIPVGSACHHRFLLTGQSKVEMPAVYLGPEYGEEVIAAALSVHADRLDVQRPADKVASVIQALMDGKVVGYFDGRMEYGPRSLGARSILFHTRDASVNDWLNKRMHRTEFMPFAPVTPVEHAKECYVGWRPDHVAARFMTRTYDCTDSFRKVHKAVVHVDGTARPQIVSEELNGDYWRVVKGYCDRTGERALINTSFNRHEEPIVCAPEDAIDGVLSGMIDVLAIGNRLVTLKR